MDQRCAAKDKKEAGGSRKESGAYGLYWGFMISGCEADTSPSLPL